MNRRPDPWRSWLVALLAVELVVGVAFGALVWSLWGMDFGDDATGRAPSWSAGPWWAAAATGACAALWTAGIVLTVRNAPAARVALAAIAGLHVMAAAAVSLVAASVLMRALFAVALLAGGALAATVVACPAADAATRGHGGGRRTIESWPRPESGSKP